MAQLENELEDSKFFESIMNQPTNIKHVTIEKGLERQYNRKSKLFGKIKALMKQMMNKDIAKDVRIISGIANEVIAVSLQNESINNPIIEHTIKVKHEKILFDLCNTVGNQPTMAVKQQEAYRLEKQWREEDEYESKQKKKEEFDKRINEVINEQDINKDKQRIAAKLPRLKLMQEEREKPMSEYEQFSKIIREAFDAAKNLIQSRTLKERIEGAAVDLNEYRKFADDKPKNNKLQEVEYTHVATEMDTNYLKTKMKNGKLVENRVELPDSQVKIMDKGVQKKEILHLKQLNNWSNATHLASLYEILGKWNLDLTTKDNYFCKINEDCIIDIMPVGITDACIERLKGLIIHNDTNTLEGEASLLPLFMDNNAKAHEHWSERK
ncbi:MAG: hypothetical protein EZS28_004313 [Streblomastix strix]|uniref:Uncharacterized protein n=1 Tax=Streblomastix strix TaxID=222440 RepID=A0A5J4X0N8_9EUKA|nr:MAG: hypothetical protein EZS28_004313 [Streblomastix strix]